MAGALGCPQKPKFNYELGPWGGIHGQYFDDGRFANIKQIIVYLVNEQVSGIKIEYVDEQGASHWSPVHGRIGDVNTVPIGKEEYLIGIEGSYGPADGVVYGPADGVVIKSLTFIKDNGSKIGPFGKQTGVSFSSPIAKSMIVGFFGWADSYKYLNAIGLHMAYVSDHMF